MPHFPWSGSHVEKEYEGFQQFSAPNFYVGKVKYITETLQVTRAAAQTFHLMQVEIFKVVFTLAWPFPTLRMITFIVPCLLISLNPFFIMIGIQMSVLFNKVRYESIVLNVYIIKDN